MGKNSINIGECLSYGYGALKRNIGFHLVAGLLFVLIYVGANLLTQALRIGMADQPLVKVFFWLMQTLLGLAVTSCFLLGYYHALSKVDAGEEPEIGDLFSQLDKLLPALLTSVMYLILSAIGFVCCIIPGLVLMPMYPISLYLVYKGESNPISALRRAWDGLRGNLVMAIVTTMVLALIGSLGFVACFVGGLITMPIFYAGCYKMTRQALDSNS
jgi:hypothetical protein